MFRTIILSITALLTFATTSVACDFDYHNAYKVVNRMTSETMSDISFEPQIEWINGHPYVSMVEFDENDNIYTNLYSYHDIILEPVNGNNIIVN